MQVRLMSYNTQHCLNYVTREIDFDIMTETIKNCKADIIGMQEMRNIGQDEKEYKDQAGIIAKELGFNYYFAEAIKFRGVNPYGNALISRYPILEAETIMIPDPDPKTGDRYYETRCVLKAKLDVGGGLWVIVTHIGLNDDEAVNAVKTIMDNLEGEKCVLMGDFNMQPQNPIFNPIKEAMFDTSSLIEGEIFSFPSDKPKIKIDYIFTSNDLKVLSADIPQVVSSDHCPHLADIEL